jgi:hydrogenase nickel incorporation protein HypB
MFQKADLVLLTKIDLLPVLQVSIDKIHDALARVMPQPNVIAFSSSGIGVAEFLGWIEKRRAVTIPAEPALA